MRRFVIHAGFHKTATSTVQKTLETHAKRLAPYVEVIPRRPLKPARKSAQVFSIDHDPVQLSLFQAFFSEVLLTLDPQDDRPVVMSSEDFSGYLIGRHGVSDYRAAPAIAAAIQSALRHSFGKAVDLTFYYSTRQSGWLKSCHWQLISNSAIHMSLEDFQKQFASAGNFEPILEAVAEAVAPARVCVADIADFDGRLGPFQPLMDLCEVPKELQDQIELSKPQNVGGSDALREALLSVSAHAGASEDQDKHIRIVRRGLIREAKKR